jgi:hypothetical protein
MSVNEALEIVRETYSGSEENHKLADAADVLSIEVRFMRDIGRRAQALLTECIMRGMPVTQEVADVRNALLDTSR